MPEILVNDVEHYYESSGKGPPLLLIHGLGSSTQDWELQTAYFSKFYRVITYDVRGHGRTDKPAGPYSIHLFASDGIKLLQGLGLEQVHVVGISMGGAIAYQMTVDAPDLVKSAVIVNFTPELIMKTFKERLNLLSRKLIVRLLGMRKMGQVLSERLFPKPEHVELRERFTNQWAKNDKRAYLNSLNALVGWSVSARLSEIECPLLVIASDEDYTPVSVKEAYMDKVKHGELVVVPDARHAVTVERPDKFNEIVERFLKGIG